MNVKKLLAIAALLSLALPALPSAAATVTKTVTVKWNTQAVATLVLHTDYAATGLYGAAAGSILANLNGGAGICTATDPTNTDLTVDFGNVTPDVGVNYTDCLYKNAVNAQVVTSSTNWNVAAAVTAGSVPADTELCALPNGVANFPFVAAALPVTQTARVAAPSQVSVANCTAVSGLPIAAASQTLANETNAFSSASPANIGHDLELVIKPLAAASGGSPTQVTVTYTLTAN